MIIDFNFMVLCLKIKRIDFNESEDEELIETPCKVSADHVNEGHQTTATKKYDLRFTGSAASRKTTR